MIDDDKKLIQRMRLAGDSYTQIAKALGMSPGTIKTYCHRNGLTSASIGAQKRISNTTCKYCGKPLIQKEKHKTKQFCSDACRQNWWNGNRGIVNRKGAHRLVCKSCGKEFKSYDPNRKYCSHACYIDTRFGGERNDA